MVPVVAVDELEELEEEVEVSWERNPGLVLELVFGILPGKFVEEWRVRWLVLLLLLHQFHLELVHLMIQWFVMVKVVQLLMVEGE